LIRHQYIYISITSTLTAAVGHSDLTNVLSKPFVSKQPSLRNALSKHPHHPMSKQLHHRVWARSDPAN